MSEDRRGSTGVPTVRVRSPNGGEVLRGGQEVKIAWMATDDTGVVSQDVRFSSDGGSTFSPVAASLPGTIRSLLWVVPSTSTEAGLIQVVARNAAGGMGVDVSNAVFTIQGSSPDVVLPVVSVIFPRGGEIFWSGWQVMITWTTTDGSGITAFHDVFLSPDGGATFFQVAAELPGTARSFAWKVSNVATTAGVIRVVAHDVAGNEGSDVSGGTFTIQAASPDRQPPVVKLFSPRGGEVFKPGQQVVIKWVTTDNSGVVALHNIRFSADGGASFTDVAVELPGTARSFVWIVPDVATKAGLIQVLARDVPGNQGGDANHAAFTIKPPRSRDPS